MNMLLEGECSGRDYRNRPTHDKGEKIAEGWRGATVQCRGDWEFYASVFNLPKWNSAERCCFLCKASNTIERFLWTNFEDDAPWRATLWSHRDYINFLKGQGAPVPVLLEKLIGFTLTCIHIDVLHTVDQGVASHIIGNVLIECSKSFGPNQDRRMAVLQDRVKQWYSQHRSGSKLQGKLTWERLRTDSGYPKLKAKAAATRELMLFAIALCAEQNSGSTHDRIRLRLCQRMQRFYEIMSESTMFLGPAACDEISRVGQDVCRLYSALSREALNGDLKGWKMTPKFHLFMHLCCTQARLKGNPKYYTTYADEDMVGHMMEIASSCHVHTMHATAMYKWLLLVFDDLL